MWPLQEDCNEFYGNPQGAGDRPNLAWEAKNLVSIVPCYQMFYAGKPVRSVRIHRHCAESLLAVFQKIWYEAVEKQEVVDAWGASTFGGSYNYRLMRGRNQLSMHSYGCAVDLDPSRNGHRQTKFNFSPTGAVVRSFESEGWIWGGRWKGKDVDAMHFQAARLR